jgi:hypothetical protein
VTSLWIPEFSGDTVTSVGSYLPCTARIRPVVTRLIERPFVTFLMIWTAPGVPQSAIFKGLRMNPRSFCVKLVIGAALTLSAPWVWGQDGLHGAWSRASLSAPADLGAPFSQTVAAADFDGDSKADGAVLVDHGWRRSEGSIRTIELHFTSQANSDLTFESNETTLAIAALDVNSDGATDIVVEQPFTHKRLHVWLNEGRGAFRKVRSEDFPSADPGNCRQLEFPAQRPDSPVLCLTAQRGSEIPLPAAYSLLSSSSTDQAHVLPFGLPIESCAVRPSSPRAPPYI